MITKQEKFFLAVLAVIITIVIKLGVDYEGSTLGKTIAAGLNTLIQNK